MQLTTTLNKIQMCNLGSKGWKKLLKYLGKTVLDDEPLFFSVILDSNGLEDALWCCYAAPEYNRVWRLYAVWCARQIQHLMIDQRSLNALDVAERYANGQATDKELSAAEDAAEDAWGAARTAAGATARAVAGIATGVATKEACIAGDIAREAALAEKAAALAERAALVAAGVVAKNVAKNVAGIATGIATWTATWTAWKTARDTKATWGAENAVQETVQADQAAKFKEMVSGR